MIIVIFANYQKTEFFAVSEKNQVKVQSCTENIV